MIDHGHATHEDFHFQGIEIPGPVMYMLLDDSITKTELVFLALVKSLSKYDKDKKTWRHCYSTNDYFCGVLKIKTRQVTNVISHLKQLGLLNEYKRKWRGRTYRYLQVIWYEGIEKQSDPEDTVHISTSNGSASEQNPPSNGSATLQAMPVRTYKRSEDNEKQGEAHASPAPSVNQFTNGYTHKNGATTKARHVPQDIAAAKQLREARNSRGKQFLGGDATGADQFRLLREQDKQDYQPTLDWFCERVAKDEAKKFGLPDVASSKAFRERYSWINERMAKELPADSPDGQTPLCEKAEEVLADLQALEWPQDVSDHLPQCVQQSVDFFAAFRKGCLGMASSPGILGELADCLGDALPGTIDFVRSYFEKMHDSVSRWDDWGGKLWPLSWKSKEFRTQGRTLAKEFSGKADDWDRLAKELQGGGK